MRRLPWPGELPYGVTTSAMIDSIIKANDKGKIKIKKVTDNTAKNVEILIDLASGISPDVTIGALYAFTHCEISISPNACVIINDRPHFLTVEELLRVSTQNTKELLRRELEIRKHELEEKLAKGTQMPIEPFDKQPNNYAGEFVSEYDSQDEHLLDDYLRLWAHEGPEGGDTWVK